MKSQTSNHARGGSASGGKVLYVITKSNWGGAQKYVFDLATNLPRDRFAVAVAFGLEGLLSERLREAGVTTFPIHSLVRDITPLSDFRSVRDLYHLFKRERPDVVHLNSSKAGSVGALAARLAGVPKIIFTAHGWPFQEKRNWFWRFAAYLGSWETALLAHTVIVVSKNDLNIGKRLPFCAHKMQLIYNGIASNFVSTLQSGARIRDAFPPGVHITGTIGETTHNKNQITLIEQARSNPEMYVAIVGEDGDERPYLESKIAEYKLADRVKLFGRIPAVEVLRGFDTFALPSLKEGLPTVLIEARAAGLPIKANRVGGVGEILDAPDLREFSLDQMLQKTIALYASLPRIH